MSGIKRISWNGEHGMEELPDGDYVLHSDHEAEVARLRAEVEKNRKDAERYREAIGIVCEGFTLPDDVRKILEKAMWSDAAMGEGE